MSILGKLSKIKSLLIAKGKKHTYVQMIMIFVVIGGLVISANTFTGSSRIDSITVEGNLIVPDKEYFDCLTIFDSPKPNVTLSQIKEEIKSHPYVDDIELYHKSSGRVVVEIVEKRPIAILVGSDGNFDYVDSDGNILAYKVYRNSESLPLIRKINLGEKKSASKLESAVRLIKSLKNYKDKALYEQTSEIIYDRTVDGFNIIFGDHSKKVCMGSNRNIDDKMEKLSAYYRQHLIKGNKEIASLDLRWANQLIVKKQ